VAKFLGNPPINIVPGKLKAGKCLLDNGALIDSGINQPDQDVFIGLRPEYLKLSDNGKIEATVDMVEHIGRDTMLICFLNGMDVKIRAIIPSEYRLVPGEQVKFECAKLFVFNKSTGERYK
jgi:ABC-type sugar transport system ATPase subunit